METLRKAECEKLKCALNQLYKTQWLLAIGEKTRAVLEANENLNSAIELISEVVDSKH